MSRRGARLSVAVLFAIALGAAAWQYLGAERTAQQQNRESSDFGHDAAAAIAALLDLRASQQAYVATGQGADFWIDRVSRSLATLKPRVASLRQRAVSPDAAAGLDAALATLDDFARMDQRATEYARAGQRLLASDMIFADGLEMTAAIRESLERARAHESARRADLLRRSRLRQHALAAGISGLALLFMIVLALAGAPRPPAATARTPLPDTDRAPAEPALAAGTLGLEFIAPRSDAAPRVDLAKAADICLDLARVADTREIPALLERAARVLDASGIVLWIADPEGRELVPTVAHGYPPSALAHVGTIPRHADNATAAAYRECKVQTVKGDMMTSGAIVAPLVTATGCAGVMAAEVRNEGEQRGDVRAVASILAAQLATLVGVTPAAQAQAKAN